MSAGAREADDTLARHSGCHYQCLAGTQSFHAIWLLCILFVLCVWLCGCACVTWMCMRSSGCSHFIFVFMHTAHTGTIVVVVDHVCVLKSACLLVEKQWDNIRPSAKLKSTKTDENNESQTSRHHHHRRHLVPIFLSISLFTFLLMLMTHDEEYLHTGWVPGRNLLLRPGT